MTTIHLTIGQHLRDAADYLAEHGWCRDNYTLPIPNPTDDYAEPVVFDYCPPACAVAAIAIATTGRIPEAQLESDDPDFRLYSLAVAAMADYLLASGWPYIPAGQAVPFDQLHDLVATWNDYPDRRPAEVIHALYEAAAAHDNRTGDPR